MKNNDKANPSAAKARLAKKEKLAAALKRNLRRRKQSAITAVPTKDV
jgi:hypothetical protein